MWRFSFVVLVGLAGCRFDLPSSPDAPAGGDAPGAPDAPDAPPFAACPSGYGPINGIGMYRVVDVSKQTWQAAAGDCADDAVTGGPYSGFTHLAVLGNDTERTMITATGTTIPGNSWIGLSDLGTEGTYLWVTDEPTGNYPTVGMTPPWDSGEPDNLGGSEDCIRLKLGFVLEDRSCTDVLSYVCECDAFMQR